MACCTPSTQKIFLGGCSTFTLLFALSISLLWPPFALRTLLYPQLVLENGTINYENWIETPDSIDLYLEIFMFNWTNPEEVHNFSVKPNFVEVGPYVFKEKHIRTNITWNENGTVTFNQIRLWHFDEKLSNGSMSDEITNYNVIAATVAYASRNLSQGMKLLLSFIMRNRTPIAVTRNVSELLFDGYSDDLLTFVRANNNPDIPKPPFDKFGWFVDRNNSWDYDGNFTMFTGKNDIEKLGVLQMWKFNESVNLYRDECDKVKGTTGELWPPIKEGSRPPLSVFATDVCRTVTVQYDSEYSKFGINGYKWVGDDRVFDNGQKYPEMSCYCSAAKESCPDLLPGLFNASSCKFGAPAFVSFPHFYLADEKYIQNIAGMNPNKKDHEFYVAMEPRTGIPLDVRAQLQINLYMTNYPWTPINNVPSLMIPMFWFRQTATLSEELAKQAKLAVSLPDFGLYLAYGLIGIGVVLLAILTYCCMFRWRQHDPEDDAILEDEE